MRCVRHASILFAAALGACAGPDGGAPEPGAREQPGTAMGLYTPEQHDLYDGRFILTGARIYQVGTLSDSPPWDHMGNDGANVRPVGGTVQIDVDEISNTGTFRAELELPEGKYVIELEEFVEFSPCQSGGIAAGAGLGQAEGADLLKAYQGGTKRCFCSSVPSW